MPKMIDILKALLSRKFLGFILITGAGAWLIFAGKVTNEWAQILALGGPYLIYSLSNILEKFNNVKIKAAGVDIDAIGTDDGHNPNRDDDAPDPVEVPGNKYPEMRIGYKRPK